MTLDELIADRDRKYADWTAKHTEKLALERSIFSDELRLRELARISVIAFDAHTKACTAVREAQK